MASLHEGTAQTPPVQTPLWQSLACVQIFPSPHFDAHDPPQSLSVSVPFFVLSEQVGT
jgi:hypothetical protein